MVERIAEAVSTPFRSPRQYMPPWHCCVRGDRIEQRFRGAKATGLANLPFDRFRRNSVWVELVLLALSLVGWAQMLLLDGELRVAEPKTLRYRLWHQAARVARHAAAWVVRLQRSWPWAGALVEAFTRLRSLLLPG